MRPFVLATVFITVAKYGRKENYFEAAKICLGLQLPKLQSLNLALVRGLRWGRNRGRRSVWWRRLSASWGQQMERKDEGPENSNFLLMFLRTTQLNTNLSSTPINTTRLHHGINYIPSEDLIQPGPSGSNPFPEANSWQSYPQMSSGGHFIFKV